MENNPYLTELGNKIRAARNAKKISLIEFGKLCKMDWSNLRRVEKGEKNVRVLTLKVIAEVLKVDVKDFL